MSLKLDLNILSEAKSFDFTVYVHLTASTINDFFSLIPYQTPIDVINKKFCITYKNNIFSPSENLEAIEKLIKDFTLFEMRELLVMTLASIIPSDQTKYILLKTKIAINTLGNTIELYANHSIKNITLLTNSYDQLKSQYDELLEKSNTIETPRTPRTPRTHKVPK